VLIGEPLLCERYREAFAAFGVTEVDVVGDSAAAGLWQVAREAGLVSADSDSSGNTTHG
jgi:2-dehydro-3-deoxygalactonokinase